MPLLLYFIALVSLSQSSNWVRWSQAPVEQLGFGRLALAALIIGCWQLYRRQWHKFQWRLSPSFQWALLASLLFFMHVWTYKTSALQTKISNQMIIFASNPLWTAALSVFLLKEKFHPRLLISYGLSLSGLFLLLAHQVQFESQTLPGDLMALLSALLFSLYLLATRKAREKMSNAQFTLILFSVTALGFAFVCWGHGTSLWPTTSRAQWAVLGLAVFSTLLGHGIFSLLLGKMNINWMSCGKLIEPVLASLMAQFLFFEQIQLNQIYAFGLTALGVILLFLKPLKQKQQRL